MRRPVTALSHIDGPWLKAEARFIANRLEALRYNGQISNDAYLDAGSIYGALKCSQTSSTWAHQQNFLTIEATTSEGEETRN